MTNTNTLKDQIIAELKGEQTEDAERFAAYCYRLQVETDKQGRRKNDYMQNRKPTELAQLFRRVKAEGLVFDGKHITLQKTGISYDYVAYKNKMLLAYPDSEIDPGVVYEGDTFTASKEDGKVTYSHKIADPLGDQPDDKITGAYCVIKNKRGEFLTLLSKKDIAKHRRVAKTDAIWSAWFKEMVLKTVLKKACKYHFDDIFEKMNEQDNLSIDLDKSIPSADPKVIKEVTDKIATIKTNDELVAYYKSLDSDLKKEEEIIEAFQDQKKIIAPAAPAAPAKKPGNENKPAPAKSAAPAKKAAKK